mgnify:CR=1 FL=1
MPKNKFQDAVFTVIMVIVIVYAMVCYNISTNMGGLSNEVFLMAKELPLMGVIAFILEFFLIGKLAQKIALKLLDPKKTPPILITMGISTVIVCFMCPIMSFFGSIFFNYEGMENIIAKWLQIAVLNFPMALCWQIFYAGPFVRFIFRKIFKEKKM